MPSFSNLIKRIWEFNWVCEHYNQRKERPVKAKQNYLSPSSPGIPKGPGGPRGPQGPKGSQVQNFLQPWDQLGLIWWTEPKSRNLEQKSNRKSSHRLETSAAARRIVFPPHQRDANPHNPKKYLLLQASTSMLGLGSEKVRKVPRALSQMPSRWDMEKAEGTCWSFLL